MVQSDLAVAFSRPEKNSLSANEYFWGNLYNVPTPITSGWYGCRLFRGSTQKSGNPEKINYKWPKNNLQEFDFFDFEVLYSNRKARRVDLKNPSPEGQKCLG